MLQKQEELESEGKKHRSTEKGGWKKKKKRNKTFCLLFRRVPCESHKILSCDLVTGIIFLLFF